MNLGCEDNEKVFHNFRETNNFIMEDLCFVLDAKIDDCKTADDLEEVHDLWQHLLASFRIYTTSEKAPFRQKLRTMRRKVQQCQNDFEWKFPAPPQPRDFIHPQDDIMQYGRELQQSSLSSLQSTVGTVGSAVELGRETANKLSIQTEQIKGMDKSLLEIDAGLSRGRVILSRMLKKTARSKVVLTLFILVLLSIGLVIYFKLH